MAVHESIREDLNNLASTARREEFRSGAPAICFLRATIVLIGFSVPDFAPRAMGPYWLVTSIAGGLLSWCLGERAGRRAGFNDQAMSRRCGW